MKGVTSMVSFPSAVVVNLFLPWLFSSKTTDSRTLRAANSSGMTDKQCNFCCCFSVVYFKGVVPFFFFVKILTIRAEYTRMYPLYKNAYKRPFCLNIKVLTRRKNERVY